jgi:hypothetical protein
MPFFAQKYLTRYTPDMFFEEYINFQFSCYFGIVELYLFKVSEATVNPPHMGTFSETANVDYC